MSNFFRNNNKKLLAIVGVFLMISFVATTRMPTPGERIATPVGRFGDTRITTADLDDAKSDAHLLAETLVVQSKDGDYQPLLGAPILQFVSEPKTFVLLQKEAALMGVTVSNQPIDQQLSAFTGAQVAIQTPNNGPVESLASMQDTAEVDVAKAVQAAGQKLVLVLTAFDQAVDINKISQPLRDFYLAQDYQQLKVLAVVFDAHEALAKLPAPTTQQLDSQFTRFADIAPVGESTPTDPFGFGYQVPETFRFQSIAVKHQALVAAVQHTKSDYDWDVAAHYYYDRHLSDYPSTQSSVPKHSLVAATRQSTTRPFDQVRDAVMTAVMKPDVDALQDKINHEIAATLSVDWQAFHAAHPAASLDADATIASTTSAATTSTAASTLAHAAATRPATEPRSEAITPASRPTIDTALQSPPSSLGVPYAGDDYLHALALKIQKDFNVLPAVEIRNQPITGEEAGNLPGIGAAKSADGSLGFVEALSDPALLPFQPSVPLTDDAATTFIFRVTERIPAHRPASRNDVESQILADWKSSAAVDRAQKQADSLADAARTAGLSAAASAAKRTLLTPAPFAVSGPAAAKDIQGLPLTGSALDAFRMKCQSLLADAAAGRPPVTTVALPLQSKVIVVELIGITPDWPPGQRRLAEEGIAAELRGEFAQPLRNRWFTPENVAARLGYADLEKNKSAS